MKTAYFLFTALFYLTSVQADDAEINATYNAKHLTPEAALIVAKGAMIECREKGTQVAVAVLDRGGNTLVVLRDQLAGFLATEGAIMKATTALNFRSPTGSFSEAVNSNPEASGIQHLPKVILLSGGLPIEASGSLLAAVGVAGAPNGEMDEQCAQAGIDLIQDALEFAD